MWFIFSSNEVYDIYKNICEANEVSAISHSVFGRELLACFPEVKKFRKQILGGNNELKYPFNLNNNFIQTDKDTNTRTYRIQHIYLFYKLSKVLY
jgi:phage/plasmid-associated DNA primase